VCTHSVKVTPIRRLLLPPLPDAAVHCNCVRSCCVGVVVVVTRGIVVVPPQDNTLLNDVWLWNVTAAAPGWTRLTAAASWSPRAGMIASYDGVADEVVVTGGEELLPPSPSPSPLVVANKVAAAAYQAVKYYTEKVRVAVSAFSSCRHRSSLWRGLHCMRLRCRMPLSRRIARLRFTAWTATSGSWARR
jgi:hypothetical protein